ncbi:MAG: hypothetical protein ABI907_13220, partial [Ramlibacter sp.]
PLPRMTRASGGQVLLTDRRTAEAMHLPHTILPSGAAMVSQRPAEMRAGVVVATAPVVAPPAVIAPAVMVAPAVLAAAALPGSTGTVITEMRDPPMTVVQDSGGVIVSELAR